MVNMTGTYKYIALGFGGLFLVPQIIHGYKTNSMRDVSTTMLVFIVIGTGLWGIHMYQSGMELYAYATGFLCLNAIALILMQLWQYYVRFKEHVSTFERKPPKVIKPKKTPVPAPAPAPAPVPTQSIILEVKDSIKEIQQTEEAEDKEEEENV